MQLDALIKTLSTLHRTFRQRFRGSAQVVVGAAEPLPLMGEYTALHGGKSLALTGDRYLYLAARSREDRELHLCFAETGEMVRLTLDGEKMPQPHWARAVLSIAQVLQEADYPLPGLDAVFLPSVPTFPEERIVQALVPAVVWVWRELAQWRQSAEEVAWTLWSRFKGSPTLPAGGVEVVPTLIARQGRVVWVDFYARSHALYDWPRTVSIVLCEVPDDTVSIPFDHITRQMETAWHTLRRTLGNEVTLRDLSSFTLAPAEPELTPEQRLYVHHWLAEEERMQRALRALIGADPPVLGAVLNESHIGLREELQVVSSIVDTVWLALNSTAGCYGARAVVTTAPPRVVALFAGRQVRETLAHVEEQLRQQFHKPFPLQVVEPADGVLTL